MALGKEIFAERPLPSAALGKAFAECISGFAECRRHSAKRGCPVVHVGLGFGMRPQFFTIMDGLDVLALCYRRCSGDATGATAAVVSVLLLPSCADHCSERVIFVLAVSRRFPFKPW